MFILSYLLQSGLQLHKKIWRLGRYNYLYLEG